jgi:hypothetical protein
MKPFSSVVLVIFAFVNLLGIVSQLRSADVSGAVKALQAAVDREAEQAKPDTRGSDPYSGRGSASGAAMLVAQLRTALSKEDRTQAEEYLNQFPMYSHSEAVRSAVEKVRTELRADRAEKEADFNARLTKLLDDTAKAVRAAKKPADLDAVLQDLARGPGTSPDRPGVYPEKIRSAQQFVLRWQDFLAQQEAGELQSAIRNLESATTSSGDILPRSEILAKIQEAKRSVVSPAEAIRAIMERAKTLDALPEAISALDALAQQAGNSNQETKDLIQPLRNELIRIAITYKEFTAGVPTRLDLNSNNFLAKNDEAQALAAPLKTELIRLVLPQLLRVEEKILPGEAIQAYLDRVLAAASTRADLQLIVRLREVQTRLGGAAISSDAASAHKYLLAGQNQESAGQIMPAVVSYQAALKIGCDPAAAKVVGARLEAIKSAHPAEFEQALQRFLNAPRNIPINRNRTKTRPPRYSSPVVPGGTGSHTSKVTVAVL